MTVTAALATPATTHRAEPIPFILRVGVTGHRNIPDDPALVAQVRTALGQISGLVPAVATTPVHLTVVSALAEGADRLVAHEALAMTAMQPQLHAVLPLPAEDYQTDFATPASRAEFADLLARAQRTTQLTPASRIAFDQMAAWAERELSPTTRQQFDGLRTTAERTAGVPRVDTRDGAYERVGEYLPNHCDVLIAIWDGLAARGRGGTAIVVQQARETEGLPIFLINSAAPYTLTYDLGHAPPVSDTRKEEEAARAGKPVTLEDLGRGLRKVSKRLDEFNRDRSITPARLAAAEGEELAALTQAATDAHLPAAAIHAFCGPLLPLFVKADRLAVHYRDEFRRDTNALFLLSALSVIVVAAQVIYLPQRYGIVAGEALCLTLIGLIYVRVKLRRLHDRYLAYRFFAERLRSRLYLSLVGVDDAHTEIVSLDPSDDAWIGPAIGMAWSGCPEPDLHDVTHRAGAQALIVQTFIDKQIKYQEDTVRVRNNVSHERFERLSYVLFGLALLFAVVHAVGAGRYPVPSPVETGTDLTGAADAQTEEEWWGKAIVLASLSLPAIFAALHGIGVQREFERNAERARQMARLLAKIKRRVEIAKTPDELRAAAWQAEEVMLNENRDWFVLMRFRDAEIDV